MLKKLFVIGLLALLYTDAQALNLNYKTAQAKMGQLCGDDCDGNCKPKPEKI